MTMTGGHLTHKPYYSSQQRWDQVRRLRWMPGDSRSTLSLAGSVRKPPPPPSKGAGASDHCMWRVALNTEEVNSNPIIAWPS